MMSFGMMNGMSDWRATALPFVILFSLFVITTAAHPADNSQARFKVEPRRVEFRLTFNLYTLQQFHRLDTNEDGKITRQELDAAESALNDYIRGHVLVTINDKDTDLGEARRMERMWPDQSAGADVAAADYAQRFVDFTFVKIWRPVVESVWIGFDIFKETGDLHVVAAVFEQEGKPEEVSFTRQEPEYLWDTGFTAADALKEKAETPAAPPIQVRKESFGIHPVAVGFALLAVAGTWLLLNKVRRISRGSFPIDPRE